MSTTRPFAMITAIATLGFVSPLLGQERSTVSGAELNAAVATNPAPRGEAVRTLLGTAQVQKVAGQLGVSASDLSARTAALDNATLSQLAQQSGVAEQDLAGGSNNVVISTTAIIIGLLILILLVVA